MQQLYLSLVESISSSLIVTLWEIVLPELSQQQIINVTLHLLANVTYIQCIVGRRRKLTSGWARNLAISADITIITTFESNKPSKDSDAIKLLLEYSIKAGEYTQRNIHKRWSNSVKLNATATQNALVRALSNGATIISIQSTQCHWPSISLTGVKFPTLRPINQSSSIIPTQRPSRLTTKNPTIKPSGVSTQKPSKAQTIKPLDVLTQAPSDTSSGRPSVIPTVKPSDVPTHKPSIILTQKVTIHPWSHLSSFQMLHQPIHLLIVQQLRFYRRFQKMPHPRSHQLLRSIHYSNRGSIRGSNRNPFPSSIPFETATYIPSAIPSITPTHLPSEVPTHVPSKIPSAFVTSIGPSVSPSAIPSIVLIMR